MLAKQAPHEEPVFFQDRIVYNPSLYSAFVESQSSGFGLSKWAPITEWQFFNYNEYIVELVPQYLTRNLIDVAVSSGSFPGEKACFQFSNTDALFVNRNIVWHNAVVQREMRQKLNSHQSFILWFTGLSGAGKSTLAHRLEEILYNRRCRTYVFDGDNVRHGLCSDLGFSDRDRHENIRRIGEMSKLFVDAGVIALTAFISPYRKDRDMVRSLVASGDFIEIYCNATVEVCETRDPKGLYKKARTGEIAEFTGVSSPYEAPIKPEISVDTGADSLDDCADRILDYLVVNKLIAGTLSGGTKE